MNPQHWPKDFNWGVATSAVQVEGAYNIDGKSFNIWDHFVRRRNKIAQNEHHYKANDFYHRYREDILTVKMLNLDSFRFSISWSRILPNQNGKPNHKGIAFYNNVINYCLELGLEPFVTLYHWDLPQYMENKGGWTNREIVHSFNTFVELCIREFGDRVQYWIPLNEPLVFTSAGYLLGMHAPGRKGFSQFIPAAYHAILANASAGNLIKSLNGNLKVGSSFSLTPTVPLSQNKRHLKAQNKINKVLNHLFLDPYLGNKLPIEEIKVLRKMEKYFHPKDVLSFKADFIGIQNYTQEVIKHSWLKPYVQADVVPSKKRAKPTSQMNWEIIPEAIEKVFEQLKQYPNLPDVYITECGVPLENEERSGQKVYDMGRVNYYEKYLQCVESSIQQGLPIKGLFFWTLHDNFEWAKGYTPKFGLLKIDRRTQKRTLKHSATWIRDMIKELKDEPVIKKERQGIK